MDSKLNTTLSLDILGVVQGFHQDRNSGILPKFRQYCLTSPNCPGNDSFRHYSLERGKVSQSVYRYYSQIISSSSFFSLVHILKNDINHLHLPYNIRRKWKYLIVCLRVLVLLTLLSNMSPNFSIIYQYFPKYRCISLQSEIQLWFSGTIPPISIDRCCPFKAYYSNRLYNVSRF